MSEERSHEYTRGLYGWITHTELSSTNPVATRNWCARVLGWTFQDPFPSPGGDYHLFAYADTGGGGIRQTAQDEGPRSNSDRACRRHPGRLRRGTGRGRRIVSHQPRSCRACALPSSAPQAEC